MFTSKLNPLTGKMEWEIMDENYDYEQELARAGFADMLHDYERNRLYYAALKKAVKKLKSENKKVHVLDIGTGTGLLSMMAVKCGSDKVTACEAFKPMIQVAKNCLKANNMLDKVHLIEKRSTEIEFGVDMLEKANVLITEVFDTELIGEGAIGTFNHALENLLEKDCYVIPDHGFMYAQVVDSKICHDLNWLNTEKYNLITPKQYQNTAGNVIYDIQLTQFNNFKEISDPKAIFKFCFSGKEALEYENQNIVEITSKNDGDTHAVFMWWVLSMDREGEILLSCAPKWAHHDPRNMQWRDHWMQAIYFPTNFINLKKDEKFYLKCNHDEYSIWFDIFDKKTIESDYKGCLEFKQPFPMSLVSRTRLLQMNDYKRNSKFIELLRKYEDPNKALFFISDDCSILPILAGRMNYKHVFITESNRHRADFFKTLISVNNVAEKVTLINKMPHEVEVKDLGNEKIDVLFSECSFVHAMLPWDSLYLTHCIDNLKQYTSQEFELLPSKINFKAIALNLENLHKIRSPVGSCVDEFDISEFDKVIMNASKKCDGFTEPHPMWEYPAFPMSQIFDICSIDLKEPMDSKTIELKSQLTLNSNGSLNGIAIWHEIEYLDGFKILTGPIDDPQPLKHVKWCMEYKQAIHLLDKSYKIDDSNIKNYKSITVSNIT